MPFFKESSGGSPAGIIIESKEQYGPQGAEAKDKIDADAVFVESQTSDSALCWLCWIVRIAALILVIIIIAVLIHFFGDQTSNATVTTREQ